MARSNFAAVGGQVVELVVRIDSELGMGRPLGYRPMREVQLLLGQRHAWSRC